MKRLLLLFIPILFLFSCEPEEENNDTSVGYNCVGLFGCVENNENPIYTSLSDCQNNCGSSFQEGEEFTVYHEIIISNNSVPGHFWNWMLTQESIYPTDPSGIVNGTYLSDVFTWNWNLSWPSSAGGALVFHPNNPNTDFGCMDITLNTYVNDVIVQVDEFVLGKISSDPEVYCSSAGLQYTWTLNVN